MEANSTEFLCFWTQRRHASLEPERLPRITSVVTPLAGHCSGHHPRVHRTSSRLWKPKAVSEEEEQGSGPETRRRGHRASSLEQRNPGIPGRQIRDRKTELGEPGGAEGSRPQRRSPQKNGGGAFCFRCEVLAGVCRLLDGWFSLCPGQVEMLEEELGGSQLTRGTGARGDLSALPPCGKGSPGDV